MTKPGDRMNYPEPLRALIPEGAEMELSAGEPQASMREALARFDLAAAIAPRQLADLSLADACRSGLWLAHHFLDESHAISQGIETPTGSFWHAIMHRREGDYDNSKYWFRQAGAHPAFVPLRQAARNEYLRDSNGRSDTTRAFAPLDILTLLDGERAWNPYAFVDLCKAACHGRGDLDKSCRTIQLLEWRTLFDYCFDTASRGAEKS